MFIPTAHGCPKDFTLFFDSDPSPLSPLEKNFFSLPDLFSYDGMIFDSYRNSETKFAISLIVRRNTHVNDEVFGSTPSLNISGLIDVSPKSDKVHLSLAAYPEPMPSRNAPPLLVSSRYFAKRSHMLRREAHVNEVLMLAENGIQNAFMIHVQETVFSDFIVDEKGNSLLVYIHVHVFLDNQDQVVHKAARVSVQVTQK